MSDADLRAFLAGCQERAEAALDRWLPRLGTHPARLHEAMRYVTLGGGKRVRPALTYAAGRAFGLADDRLDAPAAAVELIHVYSLVHDDLPAMDNDDLRRGKPTCHKAFDEATAILAGDALQPLAFHLLAHHTHPDIGAEQRVGMIDLLAMASGSRGMAGGQAIDLAAVGRTLNVAELEDMHIHKTGALLRAAVMMGALARADAPIDRVERVNHYAKCVGLAFQIQDDILDVEESTETLGKPQGSDLARNKPTFPAILGMAESKERARDLVEDALRSIDPFGPEADALRGLARFIIDRRA